MKRMHRFVDERTASEIDLETKHIKVCVWPRCDESLEFHRFGPLCIPHATDITNAVTEIDITRRRWGDLSPFVQRRIDAIDQHYRELERERAAKAASDQARPGWVYYVAIGERIKVGFATTVSARLRQYPPDTKLLAVHPGTPTVEKRMHAMLAMSLSAGREWYDPTPEVMAHIDKVIAQYGEPPAEMQHNYRTPEVRMAGRQRQVTKPKGWVG